jgi:hypothetical protein
LGRVFPQPSIGLTFSNKPSKNDKVINSWLFKTWNACIAPATLNAASLSMVMRMASDLDWY